MKYPSFGDIRRGVRRLFLLLVMTFAVCLGLKNALKANTFQISVEAASLVYFRGNQPERNQGATSWDIGYAKSKQKASSAAS